MNEALTTQTQLVTKDDIRKYFMPDGNEKDLEMFFQMSKLYGLNPFKKEIFSIPFNEPDGSKKYTIVVAYQTFLRRAEVNPEYRGIESGIIVDVAGEVKMIEGTVFARGELLGGWVKIHREGWAVPYLLTVSIDEFGKNTRSWREMPAYMIMKVAIAIGLRMVFPEDLQGMYIPEEFEGRDISDEPIKDNKKETLERNLSDNFTANWKSKLNDSVKVAGDNNTKLEALRNAYFEVAKYKGIDLTELTKLKDELKEKVLTGQFTNIEIEQVFQGGSKPEDKPFDVPEGEPQEPIADTPYDIEEPTIKSEDPPERMKEVEKILKKEFGAVEIPIPKKPVAKRKASK